jgi:hypothetical protein
VHLFRKSTKDIQYGPPAGPDIEVTPTSVSFGRQPIRTKSIPDKIILTNKDSVAITINVAIIGRNSRDFAETGTCGNRVAAGETCFIAVTFVPSAKGKKTAKLLISGKQFVGKVVTLSGTGD